MKNGLILLFTVFALLACTDDSVVNPKHESEPVTVGWRSAGFTPVISTQRGGGLQKVTHSGNWLVLMDAWTSPVENQSDTWTTLTYTPRLFISKIGSGIWDTLVPPTSASVKRLHADSAGIYVGTYASEVFEYNPDTKKWKILNVKQPDDTLWYHIYGIQKFNGRLIISMAGFADSLGYHAKILLQNDTGWQELPVPRIRAERFKEHVVYDESKMGPLYFIETTELGGNLYVGTADGVWKLDGTSLSWTELPKFPKMKWNSKYHDVYEVEELITYKGSLVAIDGTNDRVYQWDGANNWISLDSMILPPYVTAYGDTSYSIYRSSLFRIMDVVSDGKHLFISGKDHYPKVYMGDYGEPYGNVPKGWRTMRLGWCDDKGCVTDDATYGLDVVGDTIYAAAWKGLFKMPLSDLDSAISGQSDFKGFEKYQ